MGWFIYCPILNNFWLYFSNFGIQNSTRICFNYKFRTRLALIKSNQFWILLSVDYGQRPDGNLIHSVPTIQPPALSVSDKISLPLPKSSGSVCNATHGREWR
ncbi:hypothetical protein L1987_08710 [Smallanthus sonchifolius]|uniref:Uncharacterized protein n=1 Tax=Smallanthus sonchifolius TaxID=185202 RepID=A0ACB9JKX8_9ASTR|nr:hypothetical protein L1987_08710 [Smallanthus sonchifolius]